MNKHQINGAIMALAGRAQAQAGRIFGNPSQEAKGVVLQGRGRTKTVYGNVKDAMRNSRHS